MFGKLTLEQRKALQTLLIQSGMINTYKGRVDFLENAGLGKLITVLPLEEQISIFAGALVRECERLGSPSSLKNRFATVLLAEALLTEDVLDGQDDAVDQLDEITSVYEGSKPKRGLRILFLAANPSQWGKLSLQEEFERISQSLKEAQAADPKLKVHLQLHEAVRDEQIIAFIQNYQPHILHFAGHGDLEREGVTVPPAPSPGKWRGLYIVDEANRFLDIAEDAQPSGIVLETEAGKARLLPSKVLQTLFADPETAKSIRLVLLNACWAQGQAELLVEKAGVPFAIGMNQPINDKAAVRFAEGFYQTLFNRRFSMQSAFNSGKNQIVAVIGHGHDEVPTLKVRGGLSAESYYIFDTL